MCASAFKGAVHDMTVFDPQESIFEATNHNEKLCHELRQKFCISYVSRKFLKEEFIKI